jgi:hypothetical protein
MPRKGTLVRLTRHFVPLASLVIAACAHSYVAGPAATGDFGVISGQCKLMAISGQTGGYVAAQGNPRFVAAAVGTAVVAGAIGSAARQAAIYNACMEANGFVVASATQSAPLHSTPISDDPMVTCRLADSADLEISRSICRERGGTSALDPTPVTPNPSPAVTPVSAPMPASDSLEDRLQTLKNLLDRKLITPEEYAAKRKEILKSL